MEKKLCLGYKTNDIAVIKTDFRPLILAMEQSFVIAVGYPLEVTKVSSNRNKQ